MFATNSKSHVLATIFAFLFLGGWVTAQEKAPLSEKQPAANDAEKLKALLKERRDEAQMVVDVYLVRIKGNLATTDLNLLEASRILLLAELDLTDKPNERIALHQKYVEGAKEVEDIAKRMSAVGKTDPSANPITQAWRCDAEIGQLREKAGDKPSATQAAEIKKVLEERRDALREAVKINEATIRGNLRVADSNYHDLSRQLARAEVELAENTKERITARKEHVKRAKECEKIVDAQWKDGKVSPETSPCAQVSRCDAEIELLRLRSGEEPSAEDSAQIKKLLAERRDALRKELEIRITKVKGNLAVVDRTLLDTARRLLQVELELADKPDQLVSAFQDRLKDLQECEKITELQDKTGATAPGNHSQAKVARLEVEIGLLREQMKTKPPEK